MDTVTLSLEKYEKITNELKALKESASEQLKESMEQEAEFSKEHQALLDLNDEVERLRWFKLEIMTCYQPDHPGGLILNKEALFHLIDKVYEGEIK